jgi:hypothetical protein
VLGNADLALILDPGSIAMKAGVTMSEEEEAARAGEEERKRERQEASNTCWWRLPDARRRCRWPTCCASSSFRSRASSTSATGRCSTSRATAAGRGFGRRAGRGQGNPEAQIIVVVCREGNRHVGIAVSHVLDVAAGGDLFEAGTSQRTGGVTLLKNRVTGVVDLGGVAPLPAEKRRRRVEPDCGDSGMSTATVSIAIARKKRRRRQRMEMCSVRLGQALFGVPITTFWRSSARPSAAGSAGAQALSAGWCTIAATC